MSVLIAALLLPHYWTCGESCKSDDVSQCARSLVHNGTSALGHSAAGSNAWGQANIAPMY